MKLFEDMKELGGTIHGAIQQMVKNMFRAELDEEQIVEIIDKLSLSDILALDTAYSAGNKEAVQNILGPLPQLEYNMGGGRQASSQASSRPATAGATKKAAAAAAPAKTSTSSTYSGGNQNVAPVVAAPNKPTPIQPDEEELEEERPSDRSKDYGKKKSVTKKRASRMKSASDSAAHRRSRDTPQQKNKEVDETEEYTDWVLCNNDSPTEEVTETNIVEMQAWLKRRAGIIT
jgi:hypothetical protein